MTGGMMATMEMMGTNNKSIGYYFGNKNLSG